MSQYSELFRTNEVDGAELANIDNKTLSEDLGIGKFPIFFRFGYTILNLVSPICCEPREREGFCIY